MKTYLKSRPWWALIIALLCLVSPFVVAAPLDPRPCSLEETQDYLAHTEAGQRLLTEVAATGRPVTVEEGPVRWDWQGQYYQGTITLSTIWVYGCQSRAATLAHEYQHFLDEMHGLPHSEERAFARAGEVQYSPPWVQALIIRLSY